MEYVLETTESPAPLALYKSVCSKSRQVSIDGGKEGL